MMITLFDTSVATENLGDFVIMDAVRDHLNEMFPEAMMFHTLTHDKVSRPTYSMVRKSDFSFVGGTNLLSSNMNKYNQWKINLIDGIFLSDIVLMGVGWWQYQAAANFYTRSLLKAVLHKDKLHSVRDSFTENMLRNAGIDNVINTACSTMWRLDEKHCAEIPKEKADNVVLTLTDYNKDEVNDLALVNLLRSCYSQVYVWPQGSGDLRYIDDLAIRDVVTVLPPRLESYNELLDSEMSLDFVGTRLHAGVRAMQKKRRSIVVGIDNRAFEKQKDFNIPMCARDRLDDLEQMINGGFSTEISLPVKNIELWKSQFK
jgi:polysaccharide pyruvyl transferase WcaK-like protein